VTGVSVPAKDILYGHRKWWLFRTTDGGMSLVSHHDGKIPLGSTGVSRSADSDPNVIYLGTGSDDVRSNVSTGRGMYK